MNNKDKSIIAKLVEREIKHSYPRYSLRLYPRGMKGEIKNREELFKFMLLSKDAFVRLFSDDQLASRTYDCLFIDIDDADLEVSMVKLKQVLNKLNEANIYNYLINFSGSKGFHVYVWFEPISLYNYRKTVAMWLQKIGVLDLVDKGAIEPHRNVRLPATKNGKSGFYCVTLGNHLEYSFKQVLKRSFNCKLADFDVKYNVGLNTVLLHIDGQLAEKQVNSGGFNKRDITRGKSKMFTDISCYPPCMRRLVMLALEGVDLNHIERLEMGKFLMRVFGGDVARVSKFYSKMSDYNPQITEYQLNYLYENCHKNLGCDRMDEHDLCCENKDICSFHPSMNKLLAKDDLIKSIKIKRHERHSLIDF